jgi:hypothetical protein
MKPSVLAAAAMIVLAPAAFAQSDPPPHLPAAPSYSGVPAPEAPPLPCRSKYSADIGDRVECLAEQMARIQQQLDRMEQAQEHLADTIQRHFAEIARQR